MIAVLLLTGCAAAGDAGPMSPEEARLREQSNTFNRTVVEGAVAGAVIGGLIGGLVSGDWTGAAIGAGAGAVAGGASGAYIASVQKKYANDEARLDAMISDVRQDNEKLRQYAGTAEQVIAADKRKLDELNAQYAANQISRSEAAGRFARIKENRDVIRETIASLQKKKTEYAYAAEQTRKDNPAANLGELDQQIAMLEENINFLERDLNSLNDAMAVSPLSAVS